MHNISTECLFSFITNPPEDIHRKSTGIPPEIHRKSAGNPPEFRRKSTGNSPESFKFWTQEMRNKNDMNDILKGHVTMVEESQQSKRASESNLYVVPFGR